MPYILKKLKGGSYAVQNKETKHYASKATTKQKAEAQIRLLNYIHSKTKK